MLHTAIRFQVSWKMFPKKFSFPFFSFSNSA